MRNITLDIEIALAFLYCSPKPIEDRDFSNSVEHGQYGMNHNLSFKELN